VADERLSGSSSGHGAGCSCTRCTGFQAGNEWAASEGNALAVKHGVYATLLLTPRANEIAEWIRSTADHLTAADEPALRLLAQTLAHFERASGVLGDVDGAFELGKDVDEYLRRMESRARLSNDARRWADSARKLMHELGLTPAGRAELEDRTLTVVHVHEVKVLFDSFVREVAALVPFKRRDEFLRAFELAAAEVARSTGADVVLELPPGSAGRP